MPFALVNRLGVAAVALCAASAVTATLPAGAAAVSADTVTASQAQSLACTGNPNVVQPLKIKVAGKTARGLYAAPKGKPRGLVVFFHGYTETMESWRDHISRVARDDGVLAVAMNYRGLVPVPPRDGRPRSTGMPFVAGAKDSIAAAQAFDAACGGLPSIVAYGNSLGGGIAGLAVARGAQRSDGSPLFDHLIATAGLSNLVEGWAELSAGSLTGQQFFVQGKADLEEATGGIPASALPAYQQRSSVFQAPAIARSGVSGVTLIHGMADGTVLVNQSIEMALSLATAGVPVELVLAGGRPPGTASGTTLDSVALELLGLTGESPLVGHASDPDASHVVAAAGFDRLSGLVDGERVAGCLSVTFIDLAGPSGADEPVCAATDLLDQVLRPSLQPAVEIVLTQVRNLMSLGLTRR